MATAFGIGHTTHLCSTMGTNELVGMSPFQFQHVHFGYLALKSTSLDSWT